MKFKSLFLTMLGAAAIVSCNNESVIDGPVTGDPDEEVVEGLPIYATMSFKIGTGAKTYAGVDEVTASLQEIALKDAAVYIYKSDAAGMTPQCAVYLPALNVADTNGENNTVTLKTTSGNKKIFVAANVKANVAGQDMVTTTGLGFVSTDIAITAAALNAPLYSTTTSFTTTAPTAPVYGVPGPAEGLILNLAMSELFGEGDGAYGGGATEAPLMTNWDGPNDVAGASINQGGASFWLKPDIDSVTSRPTGAPDLAKNQLDIYVQRAYAKVSLKFDFAAVTATAPTIPSDLADKYYDAIVDEENTPIGRFFPWGATADAYWSLGNITTAELPFQQYVNGMVQDMFYQLTTDSIPSGTNWFLHYDNTRVFPFSATINSYPNDQIKVTNTKTTMLDTNTPQILTGDDETNQAVYNYAYATENARLNPVAHDHGTYVIVGGFYQPRRVLTSINRAKVVDNDPIYGYNGAILDGTENAGDSEFGPDNSWTPAAGDTLYYVADDGIFIHGVENLMAYYAWAPNHKLNKNAGDNWYAANPTSLTITAGDVFDDNGGDGADFGQDVANAINDDRFNDVLSAYFEGQCFYRIFIQNPATSVPAADKVKVLRNHIYDVSITSIKGPGIADPNEILIPGKPILEQDTYVSAVINVLNWHRVEQGQDVDNQ